MKIFTKGITAFTDELTNKKQIEIKKSDLKSGIYDAGNISFSDFVYNPQNDEAVSLTVKETRRHEPNPANKNIYDQAYQTYIELYKSLAHMMIAKI